MPMWGISRVDADLNGWGTHDYASELDKAKRHCDWIPVVANSVAEDEGEPEIAPGS